MDTPFVSISTVFVRELRLVTLSSSCNKIVCRKVRSWRSGGVVHVDALRALIEFVRQTSLPFAYSSMHFVLKTRHIFLRISLPPLSPLSAILSLLFSSLFPPPPLSSLSLPISARVLDATPPSCHTTHLTALCPPGALRAPRLRGIQGAATGRAELRPIRRVPRRNGPLAAAAGAEAGQAGHRTGGAAASLFHQARAEAVRTVRAGAAHPGGAQAQGETEEAEFTGAGGKSTP